MKRINKSSLRSLSKQLPHRFSSTTKSEPYRHQYGRLWQDTPEDLEKLQLIESMIRVNQAGETGAVVISEGQQKILKRDPVVREILEQEREHLMVMNGLVKKRRVRPTVLMPMWEVVGRGLGIATAMMSREVAMVVHEAVEDTITDHYNEQLRKLHELACEQQDVPKEDYEKNLRQTIRKCRDEEMHHHDLAVENNSQDAPFHSVLYGAIRTGCSGAIWVAERF